MKNKVLLSILVFTSILNADNLKIGKYDATGDSEATTEKLLNQCILNTGDKANDFNVCTKLVKLNDKLNVYCMDAKEQSYELPRSSKIADGKKHVSDDDDVKQTYNIREFNRVNWQYMNAGKFEEMKLIKYQLSLNQYRTGTRDIFVHTCGRVKINEADDGVKKHLILFSGLNCQSNQNNTAHITRGSGVNVCQDSYVCKIPNDNDKIQPITKNIDKFDLLLPYSFSKWNKNHAEDIVHAPVLKEAFREYRTNTTGRIVLKASVTEEEAKTADQKDTNKHGILIYLTEQFTNLEKSNNDIFVFGDYILGNKSEEDGYLVNLNHDTFVAHLDINEDKKERIYKLPTVKTVYDNYLSSMPQSSTYYGNEDIKKYSEQLLLKNTRISQVPTWGVWKSEFQDKYYGGLTKCYNFDLKNFNTINQVKALRLGYFLYNNSILNGGNNDINHTETVNTGEGTFYYSIHKSKDNMAGIYGKDGDYINYSVNIRPNKGLASEDNTYGYVSASLAFNFYPDAKSIEVISADNVYDATIALKDINNELIIRPDNLKDLYISKYKIGENGKEINSAIALNLTTPKSNYYKICNDLKSESCKKLNKELNEAKNMGLIILEIKDRSTGDDNVRPIFQVDGYNIIKGEQIEIKKENKILSDNFKVHTAFVKKNDIVINENSDFSDITILKNNTSREKILTRTTDDYAYFTLENPENQNGVYFEISEDRTAYNGNQTFLKNVYDISNNTIKKAEELNFSGKKLYKLPKELLFQLNKHAVGNYNIELIVYRIANNIANYIKNNPNITSEDLKNQFGVSGINGKPLLKQSLTIRHKGLIYQTNSKEQFARETKDFNFTVNSCKETNNSLECNLSDTVAKNNILTYAGLYIKDEKKPGKEIYLHLDDSKRLLNDTNASSTNPKAKVNLESGKAISIKSSLPLVSKAEIRLLETFIARADSSKNLCKKFDETIIDLKVLNTIDEATGQIYCQTPMCKNIDSKIVCDDKGFDYEFKSSEISLNLKDEKEPIEKLKGLVPYAGAQQSSSSWDGAINITDKKPLEISLNIQDKDNYYINFAKDSKYNNGLVNLNLSFEKGTDKLQQDNKGDNFKNYVMVSGSADIEIIESSANKNVDCGYTETITDNNVNIGKCINIKNDSVFTMLDELKKANARKKLSDLLNDPTYKADDTYGELKVEVAYPKVDTNGNFKTQPPFKVTLQNGYVSNEVSKTNDEYKLNTASKSHLFTKTGLYFKDVSNKDGRLFYDEKKGKANNGIKFINESNKIEDLKDCSETGNVEPCYDDKTEDLINKASDYNHDYQDSKIIVDGSDLKYKPHDDNKAEYIKDTIRYSTDKSSYLGSEKNSFTLEYKRN